MIDYEACNSLKTQCLSYIFVSLLKIFFLINFNREKKGEIQLFLMLKAFSGFNCLLSELISLESKVKAYFPEPLLASKQTFFFLLNSEIDLQSVVLWLFFS
jgi:hypothetical protein